MNASGAAHFLEVSREVHDCGKGERLIQQHLAFKGTNKRSQNQIELEVENTGATLNAYTSREQTGYQAHCFDKDAGKMVEIIADMALNSKIEAGAVEREKGVILREAEDVAQNTAETIFDHLHAVAFQRESHATPCLLAILLVGVCRAKGVN
jgi:processing peptidase subunit beta